jgi:hypothetical protein
MQFTTNTTLVLIDGSRLPTVGTATCSILAVSIRLDYCRVRCTATTPLLGCVAFHQLVQYILNMHTVGCVAIGLAPHDRCERSWNDADCLHNASDSAERLNCYMVAP